MKLCMNASYGEPYKRLEFGNVWPWTLTLKAILVILNNKTANNLTLLQYIVSF